MAYDKEVPVEIRNESGKGLTTPGTLEMLRIRVLVLCREQPYSDVKFEITSESNLFMQFLCHLDAASFRPLKKEQALNINFDHLVQMTVKLMNLADKSPSTYHACYAAISRCFSSRSAKPTSTSLRTWSTSSSKYSRWTSRLSKKA